MTNQEILKIAMAQSATDLCAEPADFEKSENAIQYKVRPQRNQKRFPPRVGGNDGKALRNG